MQMGFLQILSAGQAPPPAFTKSAIGVSYFTPEQGAFRAMRKKYGTLDDPDAGGYSLAQIDWNKDDGTCMVGPMEATRGGWLE